MCVGPGIQQLCSLTYDDRRLTMDGKKNPTILPIVQTIARQNIECTIRPDEQLRAPEQGPPHGDTDA